MKKNRGSSKGHYYKTMKTHEFYQAYANTPISDRFTPLNFNEEGMATLHTIYNEIKTLEDNIRPAVIRVNKLLNLAKKHYARRK